MPSVPEDRSPPLRTRASQPLWAAGRVVGRRLQQGWPLAPAGLTLYLAIKGVHPHLPGWPCPLRSLTGIPCPTCYLTRATSAALTGRLGEALELHAFGPVVAVGLVAWSLGAIWRRRLLPIPIQGGHLAGFSLGLLVYWSVRLILQLGFGVAAFPAPS